MWCKIQQQLLWNKCECHIFDPRIRILASVSEWKILMVMRAASRLCTNMKTCAINNDDEMIQVALLMPQLTGLVSVVSQTHPRVRHPENRALDLVKVKKSNNICDMWIPYKTILCTFISKKQKSIKNCQNAFSVNGQ